MEEHCLVDTGSNQSETDRKRESASDKISVSISSDQYDTTYYIEENAVITARFENSLAVRFVKWKRETDTGSHDIDTTSPKYILETLNNTFEQLHVLTIISCDESDAGTYFLQVSCADREISSNKIHLQVLKGSPKVTQYASEEVVYLDGSVRIHAWIRGFPKKYEFIWKKDNQKLYITDPKYKGSKNDDSIAVLQINEIKKEDEGTYTIEVHNELGQGQSSRKLVVVKGSSEVTLNGVPPVHLNESVELKATFQDVSKCNRLSVIWVKHDQDINSPHRKYEVTIDKKGSAVLYIKNVKNEDVGTYTVEVHNEFGKGQSSQKLEVIRGSLLVILKQVPLAYLNECVKLKAKIEGFSKNPCVNWIKDDQDIDITDTKYEGSKYNGDSAVLCIKDVKENDEAIYTIEVSSEMEKIKRSQKLVVIKKGQLIFISGPVVVSPSETITFHVYLPNKNLSNVKWWKIKDQSKKELKTGSGKYSVINEECNIYRFEIFNAEKEDSAAYQCTADDMKSNTIYVCVDDFEEFSNSGQGNVIRFYALQAVSAKVMRIVINSLPNTFEENVNEVKTLCKDARQTWAREFLSINTINSSEDLDISKMYTMYRNLNLKSRNWKKQPEKNDIHQADDIERIRYYRNWVCHSDASEMGTAQFNTWMLDLLGAIRRLSKDDHEVIKECCVILNRVFTTVEFIDTMETLAKEPEKLGQYILDKEEEEMKISEKEPEKLGQHIPNKEEVIIFEREPEKLDQRILNKKEEEKEIFEKEPEKLGKHFLNEEDEKMKIFEKEAEKFGQPLLSENVMFWIKFMLFIAFSLIFSLVMMYIFDLKN